MCGNSLPFDEFVGTMIGVELFPGRDVFIFLAHRISFHSPTLKYPLTSALSEPDFSELRPDQQEPQFER